MLGYALQRFVIGPAAHGEDRNILLVTLGLAVVIENALLYAFRADTRTINLPYAFNVVEVGTAFLARAARHRASASCSPSRSRCGCSCASPTPARRSAPSPRRSSAPSSAGIDVAHIYAVTFGIGTACLAIAACLLMPTYYVNPHAGNAFVLIAFTIVVLGGMGSVAGALIGGLLVGVVESLSGLYLGESLGQIGIFVMFILVLLFRPSGLFGERRMKGFAPIARCRRAARDRAAASPRRTSCSISW